MASLTNPSVEALDVATRFVRTVEEAGFRVQGAWLFGSRAKGTFRADSDLDVAIVSSDFGGRRWEDRVRLLPLREKVDLRIEPIPYRPEDFIEEDPLVWEIRTTGIPLPVGDL